MRRRLLLQGPSAAGRSFPPVPPTDGLVPSEQGGSRLRIHLPPTNRIVAFLGPYIAVVSGAAAAWLIAKVNVLSIPGLDQANLATWVAGSLTAIITAGLAWLGHSKWLTGHHIELAAQADVDSEPDTEYPAAAAIGAANPEVIPPDEGDAGQAKAKRK
jgi:hypothetical protein